MDKEKSPKTVSFPDQPNREYVRNFKKKFHLQHKTNDEVRQIIELFKVKDSLETLKKFSETFKFFKEGDRVKLDLESIKADVDYARKSEKWKRFVEENADKEFTVEYDPKHQEKPVLVCLKEDPTDPKWLWYEGDLRLVDDNGEGK